MNGVCCSVGGGAIGSAVAAMLVGALGGRAWLLTRPSAHAEAIQRQRGLWVTYPSGARKLCPVDVAFEARTVHNTSGSVDVAISAVKTFANERGADRCAELLSAKVSLRASRRDGRRASPRGAQGCVVCMQNGAGNVEYFESRLHQPVVAGVTSMGALCPLADRRPALTRAAGASIPRPGEVRVVDVGRTALVMPRTGRIQPGSSVHAVPGLFRAAGLPGPLLSRHSLVQVGARRARNRPDPR